MDERKDDAIELQVRGLHCAGCVARLKKQLEKVPGVERAEVSLQDQSARVEPRHGQDVDRSALARAIEEAGFLSG